MVERSTAKYLNFLTRPHYERGFAEGLAEGRAEGRAEERRRMAERLRQAVAEQIAARGWVLQGVWRQRLEGCEDPDRLLAWFRRVATVDDVAGVFADEA